MKRHPPLSKTQERILIDHIDGRENPFPKPRGKASGSSIGHCDARAISLRFVSTRKLLARGYLEIVGPKRSARGTVITDQGRAVLARVLGEMADALVAAGCLDPAPSRPEPALPDVQIRGNAADRPRRARKAAV